MSRTTSDATPDLARGTKRPPVRFFFFVQVALLIAVLVGFSPTFYLRPLLKVHPLPAVLYVHGAVLTVWFMLTALQGWLIQSQRVRLHRQIGYAVALYAALVIVMGLVADARMAGELDSPRDPENIVVWGNLFSLVLFAAYVSLAVVFRRTPEVHKRLTLLASVSIVGPAIARFSEWPIFPGGVAARPLYGMGGLVTLYLSLLTYDLVVRRRPHPVTLIGIVAFLSSGAVVVFLAISGKGFHILHGG